MAHISGIFLSHFGATVAVLGYFDPEFDRKVVAIAVGLIAAFIGLGLLKFEEE